MRYDCYEWGFKLAQILRASLTHPGIAALADPLSAFGGKRVKKLFSSSLPLFAQQGGGWGVSRQSEMENKRQKKAAR